MQVGAADGRPLPQRPRSPVLLPAAAAVVIVAALICAVVALIALPGGSHAAGGGSVADPSRSGSPSGDASDRAPGTATPTSTTISASSGGPGSASGAAEAVSWLVSAVPHDATVAGPNAVANGLRRAGFTRITTIPAHGTVSINGVRWLVLTGGESLDRCVPVADFGGGITACWLPPGGVSAAREERQDAAARVTAGAALARNPGVSLDATTRAAVRAGRLDLRAATVLALLANATSVRVLALAADPVETAVGRPVRALAVAVGSQSALRQVLAGLPASYQPSRVTSQATATALRWNVAVNPNPPVS